MEMKKACSAHYLTNVALSKDYCFGLANSPPYASIGANTIPMLLYFDSSTLLNHEQTKWFTTSFPTVII